jgi:predicted nucleic acid-binding protein
VIFVDSGGWIAGFYSADQHHLAASRWFRQNNQLLLTTDYIIDEALTLLKARGKPRLALKLGERFFSGDLAQIHYLTDDDIQAAWQVFRTYTDKEWSFTDCTSKVILGRLGLTHAFSFDQHFHQFGSVVIVP